MMDSYKLLDLSGSDSAGEAVHFVPLRPSLPPQRKKKLKRRERDLLRLSPSQLEEEGGRWCGCVTIGVGVDGCFPPHTTTGEAVRSGLLLVALAGLSLLTWLALHLQSRLDTTQRILNSNWLSQPASQPANQPSSQPTKQSASQPASQPTKQSASQPTKQSASQSANQAVSQPSIQPASQPANQAVSQSVSLPTKHSASQSASQACKQP
ncbi:putative hemoglobin and hemoglobin-haptoglobin-binding protein 3 [Chionoecetes opilio]|uniref:Putative hemoglobin and hemoglobin-haptoglobin-binding protein 3 n=1 Tax=Chionoecetes opilio TaxID=41210 RepID=A0A8J5CXD1_CHIOP|nr:putative hemoglobin and hemoglobin-haptoglobin-binding protein 3 [Chionoecetes opilio]